MDTPVDATSTAAWAELDALRRGFVPDLRGWFETDPGRAGRYCLTAGELFVDLSKNLITEPVLRSLVDLADQVGLVQRREAMFAGARINTTENRPVLHTALRLPPEAELVVDGQDVVAEVHQVLARMYDFADQVRTGGWLGITGQPITTVINIGIGGSDLGPVMVYEALADYRDAGIECRFISNLDPSEAWRRTDDLDPAGVLFVVVSKTFTTLETMTNARLCRQWLLEGLRAGGLPASVSDREIIARHFVAVSTNLEKVAEFGIDPANAFGFWDWVGGRYSVDSAVGLADLIAVGKPAWQDFLAGFHTMDEHFRTAPLESNVPVLMGLLNVWYVNFLGAGSHAVLPYQQDLHRFPAYLQQLTMESNGKQVRWDGSPVGTDTGEVFWGEPGTNGQHAFYQLIHQGTRLIPCDFITVANPAHPLTDSGTDVHALYLANFFAQPAALAFGKTAEEVRAEGTPEAIVPARVFPGNRPSTSIIAPALTPAVLGQLIALYEHITFVQGVIWGIDSFDQWGVELGKQLATRIAPALNGDRQALAGQDSSTRGLIDWYLARRQG